MYDIIIRKNKEYQELLLLENGNLVERMIQEEHQENIEGNIYLGKVQNVLPGMQAAFVNIGENKNTFIHLKDILPKVDEKMGETIDDKINIKEVVKPGMPILVQVKRAESNRKGARVSTHISLSGKYLVLMPNTSIITISQKIENQKECERLKTQIKELLPDNMGAIIRTSAMGKQKEELQKDVENLYKEWQKIAKEAESTENLPKLLHKGNGMIKRMLIDLIDKKIGSIIVNDKALCEEVTEMIKGMKEIPVRLDETIEENDELEKQIKAIENRKIWLKCGGFITIDKTEALIAIDVNSGKYIGGKNLEQTVYTVNKEATIEIAKQLKLRDIGGIVIIDYIDMKEEKNKNKIEELLKEELKKDRSKTQVLGFTKLNLLEMTRKHMN